MQNVKASKCESLNCTVNVPRQLRQNYPKYFQERTVLARLKFAAVVNGCSDLRFQAPSVYDSIDVSMRK